MSAAVENNLPSPVGKTPLDSAPSRSLLHYQRVDKKCLSLQVLPYTRPYVIPVSKIETSDGLAEALSTLPEIRAIVRTPDGVRQKFETGTWRLIDEADLLIRLHDWGDLVGPGAQIIVDTNGITTREAEKYASENDEETPSKQKPKTNDISSSKWSADNWKPAGPADQIEDRPPAPASAQDTIPDDSLPETSSHQGDPEWMSWGEAAVAESTSTGWDTGGHVAPADDSWADQESRSPSVSNFRRGGYRSNAKWHAAQASGNHWDKNRFPQKVHLTFYGSFQLPRRYPPTPPGPYTRFSIEVDTSIWQVARKIFARPPFDTMKPPVDDISELDFVFLELRFVTDHGKPSLESGRKRRIKGKVTLAELGLTVDGGEEGMGRYYFMIDNSFAQPPNSAPA
ncbi:hypothetical protein TWF696_005671 [Orbilia brochopaga]|uniref:Uncharacterized protein n=1 Tax=Orbilia brochopaga TaxID=3140254 RepID=A0AAV9UX92_9PEZI